MRAAERGVVTIEAEATKAEMQARGSSRVNARTRHSTLTETKSQRFKDEVVTVPPRTAFTRRAQHTRRTVEERKMPTV